MKTIATIFLAFTLAAAQGTFAQGPPGPPDPATMAQHRLQMMSTVLGLSAAQQQQASAIFTSAAASEQALHANMKSAHQALETAVHNNDSAGIDQSSGTIGTLTAQLTAVQAKANAAFYQILNADQQTKATQLEAEGPGRMFGPGGPPPPGH